MPRCMTGEIRSHYPPVTGGRSLLLLTARPMTRTKLPGGEEPGEKQIDSTLKKLLEVASTHRLEAGKT